MSDKTPELPAHSRGAAERLGKSVASDSSARDALPIRDIQEAVGKVRHGTVQLIIQDGRIVQIDTLEKKRLV